MLYLVHLDAVHLDDLLFTQSLGRLMMGTSHTLILVHGDGGEADRLLEANGLFPAPGAPLSPAERALAEQGVRLQARKLVAALTDAQVPAVGVHGGDRGLLHRRDEEVRPGRVGWLADLAKRRAVPVVSCLVEGAQPVASDSDVLGALARGLVSEGEQVEGLVFARSDRHAPFEMDGGQPRPVVTRAEVAAAAPKLADAEAVKALLGAGISVRVTTPPAFFGPQSPGGTRIMP
jgi:hypothetical protein